MLIGRSFWWLQTQFVFFLIKRLSGAAIEKFTMKWRYQDTMLGNWCTLLTLLSKPLRHGAYPVEVDPDSVAVYDVVEVSELIGKSDTSPGLGRVWLCRGDGTPWHRSSSNV